MNTPTTYADLTAAGWFSGSGLTGHRFRSIVIDGYEIMVHTDGGGVSLERNDGAIEFSEDDTVALATKIAALLRGETGAPAALEEAHATNGRLASDLAQAQAENAALRARLAELPAPADPRDPLVSTAAEEAIERIWSALFDKGGGIERDDFATAASGDPAGELLDLADAVESALDKANEQIRTLTEERDHAINIATEQFRHRLHRT